MKKRKGKLILSFLLWVMLFWTLAITSLAANKYAPSPTALKWVGDYKMTAQWRVPIKEGLRVYVQLNKDGYPVTRYYRVNGQDLFEYDFSSEILNNGNGEYRFAVKVCKSSLEDVVCYSEGCTFSYENVVKFSIQSPIKIPDGKDSMTVDVYEGDRISYSFNNEKVPSFMQEEVYIEKAFSLWDKAVGENKYITSSDEKAIQLSYTFKESGTAVLRETVSLYSRQSRVRLCQVSKTFYFNIEEKPCVHKYLEISNTATCTASGISTKRCTLCGDSVTQKVSALQHKSNESYQYDDSTHWNACEYCNRIMNEKVHTYNSAGTCTACGFNNSCEPEEMSHEYDDKYHWFSCNAIHSGTCPSNNVLFKEQHQIMKNPSAGQSAYSCQNGYVCEICDWYYGVKGQHKWVLDEKASVPATYTAEGKEVYRCAYDGMLDGRNYTIHCSETKTVTLKKLTHKWDYTKILKDTATCTKDGNKTIGCKDSGCKETTVIYSSAKGHRYGSDNTCDTCGYKNTAVKATTDALVMTDSKTKIKYQLDLRDKKSASVLVLAPKNKKITKFTVPATVKIDGLNYKVSGIADNAFQGCTKLKTVIIGKNVTYVGKKAFYGCTRLKTVSMGKNVETIGDSAFEKCKALLKITLPAKTKVIGKSAFSECTKLKTVTLGKNVNKIGEKAFYKCGSLTKITIPAKVEYIGKETFFACKKLKSIAIRTTKLNGDNIGEKAFSGTAAKATVKVPSKKLKAYKILLVQKGMNKKAKIKK